MLIGSFAKREVLNEQINGMSRSRKQLLKMRTSIFYGDFTIQCDRVIEARRPDIVLVDKRSKEVKIIDIAVPGDSRVKESELEKIEKYQMLREEIRCIWQVNKVTVIPVVVGALGAISDMFERHIKKLDVKIAMEIIQKAALLGTAILLRKVLSL